MLAVLRITSTFAGIGTAVDRASCKRRLACSGTGKALRVWATDVAKKLGATRLIIEADPDAAPFYRKMAAYDVGQAPSGSVPGRMLPKLAMNLCPAD